MFDHEINFNYRLQWTDFPSSPKTGTLNYNGNFGRMGLGITLFNDRIVSFDNLGAQLSYAYHIPVSENFNIGAGLTGSLYRWRLRNADDLGLVDITDDAVMQAAEGMNSFDVSFGLYAHGKNLTVGLSALNLIAGELDLGDAVGSRDEITNIERHYQALASYRIKGKDSKVSITPMVLARYEQGAPFQVDATLQLGLADEQIRLGATYRSTDAASIFAGFLFDERFEVAYSYDMHFSDLQRYSNGTHELTLRVGFGKNDMKAQKITVEEDMK